MGINQTEFAAIAGQSKKSQMRYEADERSPDGDYWAAIASAGVDISYVLTGIENPALGEVARRLSESAHASELAEASGFDEAGAKWRNVEPLVEMRSDEVCDRLALPPGWFAERGLDLRGLRLLRAPSASMSPLVQAGDLLMIDQTRVDPDPVSSSAPRPKAPIYICEIGATRLLARIERPDATHFLLSHDNPAFPPDLQKVIQTRILGRLVWWSHTEI